MKTFVILLSCLACCAVARRLGSTKAPKYLERISEEQQDYSTYGYAKERQQFILDVLLQIQKPLMNAELIQLGQALVTEPSMYYKYDDMILQEFLQYARDQRILGRNDVYNPVDLTHVRQLVGLQRFFVLARDYQVFQRNVAYARLYFNPVMLVDALSLAIRERADTYDLVIPAVYEILPELYYDNYILYSAQNVDVEKLVDQVTGSGSRLLDFFGTLFPAGKYDSYYKGREGRMKYGKGKEISAEIVLPVEYQGGLSADLANDIQLNVAWKNTIIDQLAQTATESIECGKQFGGYYKQGEKYLEGGYTGAYQYGRRYGNGYEQSPRYYGYGDKYRGSYGSYGSYPRYGEKGQDFVNINELPKVSADSERLLPIGRKARGYSTYVNPFYGPRTDYGNGDQAYGTYGSYGSGQKYFGQYDTARGYSSYVNPFYGPRNEYGYGNLGYGTYGSYGSYAPYGQYSQYGYKNQDYAGQKYLGQYGYNKQGYGSYYPGAYGLYGKYQAYQGAQYGPQKYGSYYGNGNQQYKGYYDQGYGSAYYTGPYAPQYYEGAYYGPYEAKYYQGAQYGPYESQYGYKDLKYGSYYGSDDKKYQGPYGYSYQKYGSYYGNPKYEGPYSYNYGSYYGSGSPKYEGPYGYNYGSYYGQKYEGPYSYNYQKYGSSYSTPYGPLYYQGYQGRQYGGEYQKYTPYYDSYNQKFQGYGGYYGQGYDSTYTSRYGGQQTEGPSKYGYQYDKYSYGSKTQYGYGYSEGSLGEIAQYIATAKQLSYERRGEILLQSIQELASRFNIERIVYALEGNTYKQQYYQEKREQIAELMQQMRTLIEQVREERSVSKNSEATFNIIADLINGRFILEQGQLSSVVQSTLLSLQQQIVSILGYQVESVYEYTPLALFYGNLRSPLTQQFIIAFAELIADYRLQLQPYTKEQLIDDIAVQNVQITPLITYSEYYDADLINLMDEKLLQSNTYNLQRLSQKVVARQQRLNYEPFTIGMDIAVEQPQEVAVRVLLVPKIDYNGRRVALSEYPKNYIVIDTFVERLEAGKNYIQRSSRQFNGYNNDATTISQLYYQVMTGKVNEQYQPSSIRQLPRNLLLPRGTSVNGGLPVQILVIATPLTQQNRQYLSESMYPQLISGFGISAVGADQLPLGYPLDRPVYNEETLYVPNIKVIDTTILYDDVIRG